MSNLSRAESRRLYSWWWDGHTSPKNSKWLQENVADIDAKVKLMIKLIEEDADSFAKRAEMYYKKRPELMKLVEEFYRAYRALAERYDHATGALRQAHRTMAEAFPNQVPYGAAEDSTTGSFCTEAEPQTPDKPHPLRPPFELDELHKDALALSPCHFHAVTRTGSYSSEADLAATRKGLKQLNELFGGEEIAKHVKFAEARVTKGISFHADSREGSEYGRRIGPRYRPNHIVEEEHELHVGQTVSNPTLTTHIMSKTERAYKVETEVHTLKEKLAKLEVEKKAGLRQYQQSLERLSNLETEISHAQDVAKGLTERASKADSEVQILNQVLTKLQEEKNASLQQYQQCLDRISSLETKISCSQDDAGGLSERASKAETEAQNLKQALARLEAEKESAVLQYNRLLEKISDLENKLSRAEEEARSLSERAVKAETEVQFLKEGITRLEEEKEVAALQYQHSLETTSYLERKISELQEEVIRLSSVIVMGIAQLNSTEEQYHQLERETQSLQSEVKTLSEKTELQEQELTEKNEELRRLQSRLQEEFMHSMQAEATLHTLQDMHFRSQEEQKTLLLELQNEVDVMNERYRILEEDIRQFQEENKNLNELNLSSSFSTKKMHEEIFSLHETKAKLEEEVDAHVEQRKTLQQELYCLREEIEDLKKRYLGIVEQVKLVGLTPDCLGSSFKHLQDENSRLKEVIQKEECEKVAVLEKLENLKNLSEKNVLLENSLSDVVARLETLREKMKTLEATCQSIQGEKSALAADKDVLISQLKTAIENVELLSGKNVLLDDTLSNANAEIVELREKSKSLEELHQSLDNEKCDILTERNSLVSHLKNVQQRLENLEMTYIELEEKYCGMEKDNESKFHQIEELQASLDLEKNEHDSFIRSREVQLAHFGQNITVLREENQRKKTEIEEEQDASVRAEVEIFILQRCIRDTEGRNLSLSTECQKHYESSLLSEKLVNELKQENSEQQIKIKTLLNQVETLRMGINQMLFVLKMAPNYECRSKLEDDEVLLQKVIGKIEVVEKSSVENQDEKEQLQIEKLVFLTLLRQVRLDFVNLTSERNTLSRDLKNMAEELLIQQSEIKDLVELNEKLRWEVGAKDQQQKVLKAEMKSHCTKLSALQEMYPTLQNENSRLLEENSSLTKEVSDLKKENCKLEEENSVILGEVMNLGNLSTVFSGFSAEMALKLKELNKDLDHLCGVNDGLEKEIKEMREKLEVVETENLGHKESVRELGNEVSTLRNATNQLNRHIDIGKGMLSKKETELSEVKETLVTTESVKLDLHRELKELKRDYDESRRKREVLEKQILDISVDGAQKNNEIGHLHEFNVKLESEQTKLLEEIKNQRIEENELISKLKEKRNEVELWEAQAATFYGDCQVRDILTALLKEKVIELAGTCESLEDENASKVMDIEQLKEKLRVSECEKEVMKSELAAYSPVIVSLRDGIISLEHDLFPLPLDHTSDDQERQVPPIESPLHDNASQGWAKNQRPLMTDGVSSLLELQTRLKAVENVIVEKRRIIVQESVDTNVRPEAAKEIMQEFHFKNNSVLDTKASENVAMQPQEGKFEDVHSKSTSTEMSSEVLMKDIPLDQVSQCSSYDHGIGRLSMSRSGIDEPDEEMFEFWEPAEEDHNLNLPYKTPEDNTDRRQLEMVKENSEHPSSEIQHEKELGVDKLVVSKRVTWLDQEENDRKILERLDSDLHKLRDLQETAEELKKKIDHFEKNKKVKKSKKAKDVEYTTLRAELKEVEDAIMQSIDINGELTKGAKESSIVSDGRPVLVLEEIEKVRKRSRVSQQAQQGSEMIGRLQLEVQRIQIVLLRLEGEHKTKQTEVSDRKIPLRDYLYGRERSHPTLERKKKGPFLGCVRPPTHFD